MQYLLNLVLQNWLGCAWNLLIPLLFLGWGYILARGFRVDGLSAASLIILGGSFLIFIILYVSDLIDINLKFLFWPFSIIGFVACSKYFWDRQILKTLKSKQGQDKLFLGFGILVIFALVLLRLAYSFTLRFNHDDDLTAYLPMAKQLLSHNSLIQPFSFRRLSTYGGHLGLQAFSIFGAGIENITQLEVVTASIILCLLAFFWKCNTLPLGLRMLVVLLLALQDSPRTNVATQTTAVIFLLGYASILTEVGRSSIRIGSVIAAALPLFAFITLRSHHAFGVVLLIPFIFLAGGKPARDKQLWELSLKSCLVAGCLLIKPALSLYASSNTLFWPLISGNFNKTVGTFGSLLDYRKQFVASDYLFSWELFVISALTLVILRRNTLGAASILSALLTSLALTLYSEGIPAWHAYRYAHCFLMTAVITNMEALLVFSPKRLKLLFEKFRTEQLGLVRWKNVSTWAAEAALGFWLSFMLILEIPTFAYAFKLTNVSRDVLICSRYLCTQTPKCLYPADVPEAERVIRSLTSQIPRGALVVAAIDHAFVLDFDRNPFVVLEIPGLTKPRLDDKLWSNAKEMLTDFQRQGAEYFLFNRPELANHWSFYASSYWELIAPILREKYSILIAWNPLFERYFGFLKEILAAGNCSSDSRVCFIKLQN